MKIRENMKIHVKTYNQKSLVIEIDGGKTVYELKKQLALYPDIGVQPELQKVIYAGKVLGNDGTLDNYGIERKKFIVVMVLNEPEEAPCTSQAAIANTTGGANTSSAMDDELDSMSLGASSSEEFKAPPTPSPSLASCSISKQQAHDGMVQNIVGMGYPESDVRRALEASFYMPERAIEYLVEGIPSSSATRENDLYPEMDSERSMSPLTQLRADPFIQELRQNVNQNPDIMVAALERIKDANPQLLNMIEENQDDFFKVLSEQSEDEDENEK